jgi:hypothetical protein
MKKLVWAITSPKVTRLPGFIHPVLRLVYEMHFGAIRVWHTFWNVLYCYPLFQGRCAKIGRNVSIDLMPFVTGPVQIHIGNDVWMGGNISIASGRIMDAPQLIIRDHSQLNWNATIVVNREVIIEEYVRISWNCSISDSDGHPR